MGFVGTGRDLKYVAQLRLAHARTNPRAIHVPGVAEPTTQSYGTAIVLRTSGQNMVTEEPLGRGAPRDRKAPTRFAFLMMDTSTAITAISSTVRAIVSKRLRACTHYLQPSHAVF